MFYETDLKPIVEPQLEGVDDDKKLASTNKIVAELWDRESEERKKAVRDEQERAKNEIEVAKKLELSEDNIELKPAEYQ